MDQQKTFVVPAFLLIEADSAASADEIACAVTETLNNLPHGHGYASLRLDECLATLEAPEGFPGGSLLQIDGWSSDPGLASMLINALQRIEKMHADYDPDSARGITAEIARDAIARATGSAS